MSHFLLFLWHLHLPRILFRTGERAGENNKILFRSQMCDSDDTTNKYKEVTATQTLVLHEV